MRAAVSLGKKKFSRLAVLHTYEHGRAEVKVLEELRDEEMRLDRFLRVDGLDLTQDVRHPVEVALVAGHAHKIHLGNDSHGSHHKVHLRR